MWEAQNATVGVGLHRFTSQTSGIKSRRSTARARRRARQLVVSKKDQWGGILPKSFHSAGPSCLYPAAHYTVNTGRYQPPEIKSSFPLLFFPTGCATSRKLCASRRGTHPLARTLAKMKKKKHHKRKHMIKFMWVSKSPNVWTEDLFICLCGNVVLAFYPTHANTHTHTCSPRCTEHKLKESCKAKHKGNCFFFFVPI